MLPTKSLVERLCDIKIYAISVLSFIGSVCAPDIATPQGRKPCSSVYCCRPVSRYSIYIAWSWLCLWPWPDLVGIHFLNLAVRYRVAACSTTLSRGLEKISTARGLNCTPFCSLSPTGKKNFLFPPWPRVLQMHLISFVGWTVMTHMMKVRKTKQKIATGLLLDKLHKQDFAGPLSSRAPRVLGPISRYRVADILHHMRLVSRACRPGLLFGFLRIMCNGL